MNPTIRNLEAQIAATPVRDQASLRALYTKLSHVYAELLRPTR